MEIHFFYILQSTYNQGSIRCGPFTPRLSKKAYIGISQKPGSLGSPLQTPSLAKQLLAIPLSKVYGLYTDQLGAYRLLLDQNIHQYASVPESVTGIEAAALES